MVSNAHFNQMPPAWLRLNCQECRWVQSQCKCQSLRELRRAYVRDAMPGVAFVHGAPFHETRRNQVPAITAMVHDGSDDGSTFKPWSLFQNAIGSFWGMVTLNSLSKDHETVVEASTVVKDAKPPKGIHRGRLLAEDWNSGYDENSRRASSPTALTEQNEILQDALSNRLADRFEDDDGIEARLASRARAARQKKDESSLRTDLFERLETRPVNSRGKAKNADKSGFENRSNISKGPGGFFLFGRHGNSRQDQAYDLEKSQGANGEEVHGAVKGALPVVRELPIPGRTYGGLCESQVYNYIDEAMTRRSRCKHEKGNELETILPYDLQRALFDELRRVANESGISQASARFGEVLEITDSPSSIKEKPGTCSAVASDVDSKVNESRKEVEKDRRTSRTPETNIESATSFDSAGSSLEQPEVESKKFATNEEAQESETGGGALQAPLRVIGDLLRAVSWMRGDKTIVEGEKEERKKKANAAAYAAAITRDMRVTENGDSSDGSAAAAFAAAAAIASSSRNTRLDSIEEAGLSASVSAARAISSVEDARVFVETVGVGSLVTAIRVLPGFERSSALTALANVAIMLPNSRVDMLKADGSSIVQSLIEIVQERRHFSIHNEGHKDGFLCHTEALVSGTHLLGSLALAKGKVGQVSRQKMALNTELVRSLRRLAGGLKNGEPEGAARAARRALGALGINNWKPRMPGQRGLRILSIDGGGTRAIMAFEMLKHLKRTTGCEIHEMFDIIGGTSTGAIVAASLGMAHKTVEEVELLYRDLIGKIFAKHPVNGPKMLLTRAYYDTGVLESTLKRECGKGVFIDSLAEENMNKVLVISSIMSRSPQELHVFRNYTYPLNHESRYDGTVEAQLWEALRASSAAPTFFSEIRVNGEVHADGAIVANNPTAIALHETKCMYPGVPIELVISIGNGLSPAYVAAQSGQDKVKNVGWGDVVGSIVASATSTETVHHALLDLFPSEKYFRFNPITDSKQIDETRPDQLALFVKDSKDYIAANRERFETVCRILRPKTPRSLWRRFRDALQEEIQVLQTSMEDDLYLPNKSEQQG